MVKINKLILILTIAVLSTDFCFGQTAVANQVVIQGNLKNYKNSLWTFALTGFYNNQIINTEVDAKGNFSQVVSLEHPQDLLIPFGEEVLNIFVIPGDTLKINWDGNNLGKPLVLSIFSPSKSRQQELNLMVDLHQKFNKGKVQLRSLFYDTSVPATIKYSKINGLFNEYISAVNNSGINVYYDKIACDIYYEFLVYVQALNSSLKNDADSNHLQFNLTLSNLNINKINNLDLTLSPSLLSEVFFYNSKNYRTFLKSNIGGFNPFKNIVREPSSKKEIKVNRILTDCYLSAAVFKNSLTIRDWYLVNSILSGFENGDYAEAQEAYLQFKDIIQTKLFKDHLIEERSEIKYLMTGDIAPNFKLKDESGKEVSLNDFKGQVVFMDFWGNSCVPCIADLKKKSSKLLQRYKDVVFLNICIDGNKEMWKKNIKTLKIGGVNLITEGWMDSSICRDYNVKEIPHYVIIDRNGHIVNPKAPELSDLTQNEENDLDRALKLDYRL